MSIFDFFYNLKTSFLGAMSTSGMFTRLRAKLTSQQISTKEVSALAEREEEANKKALNQSISDAVLEAVRNEEFIKAVAVQLASELQPSFQELGPSAYNDRLQAHIEILKKRFDVQDTKLTHLSTILESNNLSTAEKICRIEEASNSISKYQGELSESTKVAEENQNAQLLSLGTQMELVQEKILILSESLSDKVESIKSQMMAETTASLSEINLNLKNISKTLEEQSTKLVEIKDVASSPEVLARIDASNELNTTQVAALSELKSLTEKSFNEFSNVHSNSSAISSTLDSNISKIDDIKNLLTDITNSETNQEILAETKASNESLVIVTNTLSELKSGQSEILPSISISNDAIKSLCRDLEDIKKTESSLTENFKMASLNTSAQSEVIEDVKSFLTNNVATIAGIATIEQSVDTLKSSTDNMNALLDDLKITVSRPQPIAEKVDLSKLESSLETITTEISQIKAANETLLGETHLAPLLSTLDAQSTKLMEIKSTVLASVQSTDKFDLSSIESSVKDLSSMLESQISSLGDLKKSVAALENTQKTDISGLESLIQKIDLSGLESSIQKIDLSRLETSIQKIDISSLESSIQKVIQTLESQKEALANSNTPTDS
ncbi:putative cd209 antigen [Golovinomyces cichoracearum]|uniref:Putative cd209 antigen n=1 Tax=Golovinomyces cichoracearum TaxID=62708 RepID=A0A420IV56_9PEZI|nr:putative cd209 antigen [Golovinomyces cichoracearum]